MEVKSKVFGAIGATAVLGLVTVALYHGGSAQAGTTASQKIQFWNQFFGQPQTSSAASSGTAPSTTTLQPMRTEPSWAKLVGKVTNPTGFSFWRSAYSVWEAGSEHNTNYTVWDPIFVYTGLSAHGQTEQLYQLPSGQSMPTAGTPTISIFANSSQPSILASQGTWTCPQTIGLITITGVSGSVVSFTSVSNVSGTFELSTHQWNLQ